MNIDAYLQQALHTWTNGGWVMIALALLALVMYATMAHLMVVLYHRGIGRADDADLRRWVADPSLAPGELKELIRYTQDDVASLLEIEGRFREVEAARVSDFDRRLAVLKVLVIAAPLFGLLGTVLGMLLTFKAIGVGGSSAAEVVAKGISEALVATQTGMMVALPGLMGAFVAKRWRNHYVAFLARLRSLTLRQFRAEFQGQAMRREFVRPATVPAQSPTPVTPPPAPETAAWNPA